MNVNNTTKTSTLIALIVLAAATRWLPHPPNFTAIGAMALFAGAFLQSRVLTVFVPLAALFLGDLIFGFHHTMVFVYASVAISSLLSFYVLKNNNVVKTTAMALFSSLLFFAVTNFGVWLQGGLYTADLVGLKNCYLMAIPFFRTQVVADLFYSAVLFGAWAVLRKQLFVAERA